MRSRGRVFGGSLLGLVGLPLQACAWEWGQPVECPSACPVGEKKAVRQWPETEGGLPRTLVAHGNAVTPHITRTCVAHLEHSTPSRAGRLD